MESGGGVFATGGKFRDVRLAKQATTKLEDVFNRLEEGNLQQVNLIVKADVQGSVEALSDALLALSNEEVKVNVVARGLGGANGEWGAAEEL